jgi:hypothetical protein
VMTYILAKMRQCYVTATQEATKLDDAVAKYFPRLGSSNMTSRVLQAAFSECGACQQRMSLKQERSENGPADRNNLGRRKILFCSTCQRGLTLPKGVLAPMTDENGSTPQRCPICRYQVVQVSTGEGYEGRGYTFCPKCFSDPPLELGGSTGGGEFRCFNCAHPTCSLSRALPGSDIPVFPCPFCEENRAADINAAVANVFLSRNSRGYVLSCKAFVPRQGPCAYTIWLPKESDRVSVAAGDENHHDTLCGVCSAPGKVVRKVNFVFRAASGKYVVRTSHLAGDRPI